MCTQSGGFYSAEDADSLPTADATSKREGAFCVWSYNEVRELLIDTVTAASGAEVRAADIVCFHYDVRPDGNVEVHKACIKLVEFDDCWIAADNLTCVVLAFSIYVL